MFKFYRKTCSIIQSLDRSTFYFIYIFVDILKLNKFTKYNFLIPSIVWLLEAYIHELLDIGRVFSLNLRNIKIFIIGFSIEKLFVNIYPYITKTAIKIAKYPLFFQEKIVKI